MLGVVMTVMYSYFAVPLLSIELCTLLSFVFVA